MEDTLATLVAMPTISADTIANQQALDYVQERLAAANMHCRRFTYNGHGVLLATSAHATMQPRIALYGHIDVVAGSEQVFTMRREGDKLMGRGVHDMKFAIATYIELAESLKDRMDEYDFGIVIVTDEEQDDVCLKELIAQEGFVPQMCLMPDGSYDWNIERTAKGWWRFQLISKGLTAHSSRPWEGESASFKLVQALHELRERFAEQSRDTDTLNIGKIHGGDTYNQVPDHMVAQIEIRLATDENLAANRTFIADLCKKYDLETEDYTLVLPEKQRLEHPLVQQYMAAVEEVTGYRPQETLSLGGSDSTFLNAVGVPCAITYLPGGGHHSENEWVSRPDFLKFLPVVQNFIERTARR